VKILILEGPEVDVAAITGQCSLRGWRHYQFVTRAKTTCSIGHPDRIHTLVDSVGAAFYAAGTWENPDAPAKDGFMPVPRPEIVAEIFGRQMELAER
jgi:hypothetical protein